MSTIEKGSLVLITGVTGFVASHTADQFLADGYRVRGTVRSLHKADWLYELFDNKYGKGKFEAVEVKEMMADGAFDDAVIGVSGICHMASILTFSDKPDEVIPPVVKGALNVMTAATKEPGVKSVVYTSSSTAALMPHPNKYIKVTKETWNDDVIKASETNPDSWNVYGASKTLAEKAISQTVSESRPPFQVAYVLPNANLGTIIKPGGEDEASTASWVTGLYKGDTSMIDSVPPQYFVDVRDTARLHVIALIDPSCNGQRIFAFAAPFNWNDILDILRKLRPDKDFPENREDMGRDLSEVPNKDAEELLKKHYGHGFISLEETIAANIATLK